MVFKDLKQNYPIFILDKQEYSLLQGIVSAISFPRVEMNQKTGKAEMMVDVTVDLNGKVATYSIPESLTVTYAGNLVISTEKQALLGEIEALKMSSEQLVKSAESAKVFLSKYPDLKSELNPEFREKQEIENRFGKLEGAVSEMKEMMSTFIKKFEN